MYDRRLNLRCPCCGAGGDDDCLRLNLHDGIVSCSECDEEITAGAIQAAKADLDKLLAFVQAVEAARAVAAV